MSSIEGILTINDKQIKLNEEWEHGIGGGLWSTGLAIAKYMSTKHGQEQLNHRSKVLELGSGNGFLGVCLMAANPQLETVVITDTKEHLPLIEKTLILNGIEDKRKVRAVEYLWGPNTSETPAAIKDTNFDLIIGSDLAYRDELHDPLIASIVACSSETTVTLLGVTMRDTRPIFFQKLIRAGLKYERLADHLLESTFRGKRFGVFVIWKATACK
jgi:predicted nicotinamide N-methyase